MGLHWVSGLSVVTGEIERLPLSKPPKPHPALWVAFECEGLSDCAIDFGNDLVASFAGFSVSNDIYPKVSFSGILRSLS